ncbi:MAG: hypothetical protein R3284_11125 [Rubricoccaceae bacterium]|nr:hypothetical protein [Rubricoccaceae bacterium]
MKHWNWRPKLRWFAAEIAVVVVGVLIALALNAWWQRLQAAEAQENYLALISRDLGDMATNLEELQAYEDVQVEGGLEAYRIISANDQSPDSLVLVSDRLQRLTGRRTMSAVDATYTDLTSTGNLPLIRNQALRDQIISYYEKVEREFEIHNKNNSFFVDEMFARLIEGSGLFVARGGANTIVNRIGGSDSLMTEALRGGYVNEPDAIWSLPYSSPEWARVKAQLVNRIRISGHASLRARALLEETRALREAVEAELNR